MPEPALSRRLAVRIDKALDSLSLARTALDDPAGLPENEAEDLQPLADNRQGLKDYAIEKIDDAMRLLGADVE